MSINFFKKSLLTIVLLGLCAKVLIATDVEDQYKKEAKSLLPYVTENPRTHKPLFPYNNLEIENSNQEKISTYSISIIVKTALSWWENKDEAESAWPSVQKIFYYEELYNYVWPVFESHLCKEEKQPFEHLLKMMCNLYPVQKNNPDLCFGKPPHDDKYVIEGFQCALSKILQSHDTSKVDDQKRARLDLAALHKKKIQEINIALEEIYHFSKYTAVLGEETQEHAPCESCITSIKFEYKNS